MFAAVSDLAVHVSWVTMIALVAAPILLIGATLGVLGTASGRRALGVGCGVVAGLTMTVISAAMLLPMGVVALLAPLFGATISFAVGRAVAKPL